MPAHHKQTDNLVYAAVRTTHNDMVFLRRIKAIAHMLEPHLGAGLILDVGCGDGSLAAYLQTLRSDIRFVGVDVGIRPETRIPAVKYDGIHLPFDDDTFDGLIIVDVLHHTNDPIRVLSECLRVSRGSVLVKDHFYRNILQHLILRAMDWVGNAPHGVPLPYNYFRRVEWEGFLQLLGAEEVTRQAEIANLYPPPAQWLIGRDIQFLSQIKKRVGL